MKKCELCTKEFGTWKIVDGKKRNLCNRKYCTDCSPFKSHNTKLLEKRKKVPSDPDNIVCYKCLEEKSKNLFYKGGGLCKKCSSSYSMERWIEIKKKAISHKGGECSKCGYNNYYGALEFHHRDPQKKEFSWTKLRLRPWDAILKELDKCDLLCSNCHRERHHEEREQEKGRNGEQEKTINPN